MLCTRHNECNERKKCIRSAKRNHEIILSQDCKTNPKMFWRYVQEKVKNVSGISPLLMNNGDLAVTNMDKANTLNEYFSSVFIPEDINGLPHYNEGVHSKGVVLADLLITPASITDKLSKLNKNKAQGPDKIPPRVLQELCIQLGTPLSILFNKSIEKGQLPQD